MNNIEILRLDELGGEYIANRIIERSKDTNIIYLTEDIILNTKCVQQLAQYLENLIAENKELKEENWIMRTVDKQYINKDKIKEIIKKVDDCSTDMAETVVFWLEELLKE